MKNLSLYSNCKIVRGYLRDLIIDLEREIYFFIPKDLTAYLNGEMDCAQFSAQNKRVIIQYHNFLQKNRLVHFEGKTLKKKNSRKDVIQCHSNISSGLIIVENNNIDKAIILQIVDALDEFGCQSVLLIFKPSISSKTVHDTIQLFAETKIRSIEIIIEHSRKSTLWEEKQLVNSNPRIVAISYYKSDSYKATYIGINRNIFKRNIIGEFEELLKRKILPIHFAINISFYNESLKHNPFYLKKIILNHKGEVYRDLNRSEIVGNILDSEILGVMNNLSVFQFAFTGKGKIDICKKCEFRNICPDSRVPINRNEKEWYMQTECNYNPFIAKWNGETGYKTLAECGIQSDSKTFSIDTKKVKEINNLLW